MPPRLLSPVPSVLQPTVDLVLGALVASMPRVKANVPQRERVCSCRVDVAHLRDKPFVEVAFCAWHRDHTSDVTLRLREGGFCPDYGSAQVDALIKVGVPVVRFDRVEKSWGGCDGLVARVFEVRRVRVVRVNLPQHDFLAVNWGALLRAVAFDGETRAVVEALYSLRAPQGGNPAFAAALVPWALAHYPKAQGAA